MRPQVADRSNPKLGRQTGFHSDDIRVVEPERIGHLESRFREFLSKFGHAANALTGEDFLAHRSGVFRVDVNLPAKQRFPKQARPAKPLDMLRVKRFVPRKVCGGFGEDH